MIIFIAHKNVHHYKDRTMGNLNSYRSIKHWAPTVYHPSADVWHLHKFKWGDREVPEEKGLELRRNWKKWGGPWLFQLKTYWSLSVQILQCPLGRVGLIGPMMPAFQGHPTLSLPSKGIRLGCPKATSLMGEHLNPAGGTSLGKSGPKEAVRVWFISVLLAILPHLCPKLFF